MRFQVLEIGIIDRGELRIESGYHPLGTDRVSWRTAEGEWQEGRLDPRGDCTILADLSFYLADLSFYDDLDFCDDLEHAERIFLGAWVVANRIADLASAPVPRTMLHNAAGEILLGNRFEMGCYPDGTFRVVVFHKQGHERSAKYCTTEAEAVTTLRDFLALQGED